MDVSNSTVQLNTSDGKMDAYVAQPKDGGSYPGIVVIQEAFGVNDHMKKVTDRIAAEGYVAICPDIFHREAERVIPFSDMAKAIATLQRVQDPKAMEDVGAAIAHLKSQSNVKSGSLGVVGFCMGGRLTYLTAAHHANDVKCAVPYYGGGITMGNPSPLVAYRRDQMPDVSILRRQGSADPDGSGRPDQYRVDDQKGAVPDEDLSRSGTRLFLRRARQLS